MQKALIYLQASENDGVDWGEHDWIIPGDKRKCGFGWREVDQGDEYVSCSNAIVACQPCPGARMAAHHRDSFKLALPMSIVITSWSSGPVQSS